MPRKPLNSHDALLSVFDAKIDVQRNLAALGFEDIHIGVDGNLRTTITARLAGQNYVASTDTPPSLNAAESIMVGYWRTLTENVPFDPPFWVKDQAAARDAEDDGYAPAIDD